MKIVSRYIIKPSQLIIYITIWGVEQLSKYKIRLIIACLHIITSININIINRNKVLNVFFSIIFLSKIIYDINSHGYINEFAVILFQKNMTVKYYDYFFKPRIKFIITSINTNSKEKIETEAKFQLLIFQWD